MRAHIIEGNALGKTTTGIWIHVGRQWSSTNTLPKFWSRDTDTLMDREIKIIHAVNKTSRHNTRLWKHWKEQKWCIKIQIQTFKIWFLLKLLKSYFLWQSSFSSRLKREIHSWPSSFVIFKRSSAGIFCHLPSMYFSTSPWVGEREGNRGEELV